MRLKISLIGRILVLVSFILCVGGAARGATFTVNSTSDFSDIAPGDGVCTVNANNVCGLRAAIEEANAFAGTDTIAFAIPNVGAGVKTFNPATAYMTITQPVVIDGWTQGGAGYTGVPLVELNGWGLSVIGGGTTIRGLVINNFTGSGIALSSGDGNTVQGCYIGTDTTGTIDLGGYDGIAITGGSANNLIGGVSTASRNVISGNFRGVFISDAASTGNLIRGNYIGTDASGAAALGNSVGVEINAAAANTIGGTLAIMRNIISGNTSTGVKLLDGASANFISGNYIGTDASGAAAIPNEGSGISLSASTGNTIGGTIVTGGSRNVISGNLGAGVSINSDADANVIVGNYIGTGADGVSALGNGAGVGIYEASDNQIGGTLMNEANVIAFNGDDGVSIQVYDPAINTTSGNSVRGNSIHSNDFLGIDLDNGIGGGNGVSPNDAGDLDEGANNTLNYPVLTGATNSGGATNIEGTLNSRVNTPYTIDFYSSPTCDATGNGEGETYLGSRNVTTDAGGNAAFTFSPAAQITFGHFVTATTTRQNAPLNTSEFSECAQVLIPNTLIVTNTTNGGAGSLRQAILDANAAPGLDTIYFNIAGAGVHKILLTTPLPTITDPVFINGATQPGYAGLPLIELDGTGGIPGTIGLQITAGGSTIKSLIINKIPSNGAFGGDAISLSTGGGNTIVNCFIGTDATGTLAQPNGGSGIVITNSANNRIGGGNGSTGNIISANVGSGIVVTSAGSTGNLILGNVIGSDINRTLNLGNNQNGVLFSSSASNNSVGGSSPNEANLIAHNNKGVAALSGTVGNSISGNSIHSSDDIGIDLYNPAGVTLNDQGDLDTGANNLQNFPVLAGASNANATTRIQGSLNSAANASYTVEFFSSPSCDSSGYGEGEIFIGSKTVTTDQNGSANFAFTTATEIAVGRVITATTTRRAAPLDTSEFSQCVIVVSGLGNLTFSAADYPTNENTGTKIITVNRTGGTTGQVTVNYATSNGTAIAGQDYAATSGTLTFLSGETTKTFNVPITNDTLDEEDETINLTLSNPTNGVRLEPFETATLTIQDNDAAPLIAINNAALEEGSSGTTNFNFTVSLSAASGKLVTVSYAAAGGTATSGVDLTLIAGTLVFAPGDTSETITVAVNGDLTTELNETFFVNLSNPVSAAFGDNQGLGTIIDDDNPGRFSFTATPYAGVENTQVLITVSRAGGDAGTVSVDYSTSGGSATPFLDYAPLSDTLIFSDGETNKTFTVNLLDDPQLEPTENFNVVLSNPIGGASLGTPSSAAVNILDNDSGTLLTISGEILKADNTPLIGATVNLTGAQSATVTTNNLGRYSFPNLAPNGHYAVAPSSLGYTFSPISRQYNNLSVNVTNANFTATLAPTRQLRIVGGNATPGQNITANIELVAQGDENSAGFSLDYDPAILTNPTAVLGADAVSGFITVNPSAAGKVGILLALPAGQTFAAGTRQIVTVTFNTLPTNAYNSPVTFGNVPIVKEVSNTNADPLPTNYLDGTVTFAQGYESDVAPRPTGNNTGSITITDFTQTGRFVAGLDTLNPNFNEFQRADSAPRVSLGNGLLTVSDYTQAGRYAAGLDAATLTGGQYAPSLFEFGADGKLTVDSLYKPSENKTQNLVPTVVRVVNTQTSGGSQVTLSLETDAQGTENGFGFTLDYDQTKLSNPLVSIGSGIPNGSTLIPNTSINGKVGVVMGLPFGTGLTAGTKQLVTIRFDVAANAAAGNTALVFSDSPVVREVSDTNANILQSTFQDGAINILGPTAADVSISGRVLSDSNRGVSGATVSITDGFGNIRLARSNSFGYYRFDEVSAGETYVLAVRHKSYQFAPQVVAVNEELSEINFVANGETP